MTRQIEIDRGRDLAHVATTYYLSHNPPMTGRSRCECEPCMGYRRLISARWEEIANLRVINGAAMTTVPVAVSESEIGNESVPGQEVMSIE